MVGTNTSTISSREYRVLDGIPEKINKMAANCNLHGLIVGGQRGSCSIPVASYVLFRLAVTTSDPRNPEVRWGRRVAVGWELAVSLWLQTDRRPAITARIKSGARTHGIEHPDTLYWSWVARR